MLRTQDPRVLRLPGNHAPDGLHRIDSAGGIVAASRNMRPLVDPGAYRHDMPCALGPPERAEARRHSVEQGMLDRDGDAEPDRASALFLIGQKGVLDDQRVGRQAGMIGADLFVDVEHGAHRPVADGVGADLPPSAHGFAGDRDPCHRDSRSDARNTLDCLRRAVRAPPLRGRYPSEI